MAEKNLSIKLSLNDKQFQSNLKKSMRSMKKFGNNMKSLGRTISTGLTLPILAFGAASVKAFDEQINVMSRTRRKDKEGNVFWDGRRTREINHRCRCGWCTGVDKKALEEKIADKEMKRQLRNIA